MADFWKAEKTVKANTVSRACFCIGPQNGDPVCPCMTPEYTRRKLADMALEILMKRRDKPRIRVKAGSRVS
jgi:hypothetical protein